MSTKRVSKIGEFRKNGEAISDEALDFVVGGLNPQPLPPRVFYSLTLSEVMVATGRFAGLLNG